MPRFSDPDPRFGTFPRSQSHRSYLSAADYAADYAATAQQVQAHAAAHAEHQQTLRETVHTHKHRSSYSAQTHTTAHARMPRYSRSHNSLRREYTVHEHENIDHLAPAYTVHSPRSSRAHSQHPSPRPIPIDSIHGITNAVAIPAHTRASLSSDDLALSLEAYSLPSSETMFLPPPSHPLSNPYNDPFPAPPPPKPPLTTSSLLHSLVQRYLVPLLPADVGQLILNPPNLRDPASLVPLLRTIAPYTQFLLVLVALYVVWAVVAGFLGYLTRFFRFCLRIGPVIAIVAWIMAASGQGGVDVLFEALKQYAGMDNAAPAARAPPGRGARPGGVPGMSYQRKQRRYSGSAGSGSDSGSASSWWGSETPRRPQRKTEATPAPDFLSSLFGAAINANGEGEAPGVAGVQDYVKRAVARAAGLEWLLPQQQEEGKKTRSR